MIVNNQVRISAREKTQSDSETPDELLEFKKAFEEFECKCPEACPEMECFEFNRGKYECPICHAGCDWYWLDFMAHGELAHGIVDVWPGDEEWLVAKKEFNENTLANLSMDKYPSAAHSSSEDSAGSSKSNGSSKSKKRYFNGSSKSKKRYFKCQVKSSNENSKQLIQEMRYLASDVSDIKNDLVEKYEAQHRNMSNLEDRMNSAIGS